MPSYIQAQCQSIGWTTEKQKRKKKLLFHRSTVGFFVTCGVHQACQNLIPNQKFPERKNFCLKNSSPVNHETEYLGVLCLLGQSTFGCLFLSYSLLLPSTNESPPLFGQGKIHFHFLGTISGFSPPCITIIPNCQMLPHCRTCVGTHGVKSTKTVTQEENSVWAQGENQNYRWIPDCCTSPSGI